MAAASKEYAAMTDQRLLPFHPALSETDAVAATEAAESVPFGRAERNPDFSRAAPSFSIHAYLESYSLASGFIL